MEQTHVKTAPNKERSNMVKARIAARLSQKQVAEKMKVGVRSIINWEKAHTTPYLSQIEGLRDAIKFTGTDEELLQVFIVEHPVEEPDQESHQGNICPQLPTPQQLSTTCQTMTTRDIVDSADSPPFVIHIPRSVRGFREFMDIVRRQFIEVVAKFGGATLFSNISIGLVPSPTVDPEEYLALCSASIGMWWQWLYQGNYHELERVLLKNVPVLKRLATTISPFQEIAASLAAQAKFMQILLATRNLQFRERELYCADAVRFGALSGDRNLHAIALEWHGNTYTLCHRRPQRAIAIFNEMLPDFNSDISQLTRSAIYCNLSVAHAQVGDETKAIDYIETAHTTMPSHPELDFSHRCIQFNSSSLDHYEGKMYLHLAEHFPDSNYARKAYYAIVAYTGKQAIDRDSLSASLIKKADAARALGEMGECVECLTEGFRIGVELDCLRRLIEANDVIERVPWKTETAIQDLQKEITHAIVVRR